MKRLLSQTGCSLLLAGLLAACGGGGGGNEVPPDVNNLPQPIATAVADNVVLTSSGASAIAVLANDTITLNGKIKLDSVTAPAHGTATISGDTIVYTPAAGFAGTDTFTYTILPTVINKFAILSSTATVTVNVQKPLTLLGHVEMPEAPGVQVNVQVGAKNYTTTTDASGNFSVPAVLDDADNLIIITAQGTGNRSNVKLVSVAGSARLALQAAGTNASVSPAVMPGLNVSYITSASYGLTRMFNNGQMPATAAAYTLAETALDEYDVLEMAKMIMMVAEKGADNQVLTLPAGVSDTLALVLDKPAFMAFRTAQMSSEYLTEIYDAEDALKMRASMSSPIAWALDKPKTIFVRNNLQCCLTTSFEITLNPDRTATVVQNGKGTGTWLNGPEGLVVTLSTPLVYTHAPRTRYENTTHFVLRQISGGPQNGMLSMKRVGFVTYPDDTRERAPFEMSEMMSFHDFDGLPAVKAEEFSGATIAGLPEPLTDVRGERQMVMTFNADGTARAPAFPALAATWSIVNGRMVVNYGDGAKATLAKVPGSLRGEQRWLTRFAKPGVERAYAGVLAAVQPGVNFLAEHVASNSMSGATFEELNPSPYIGISMYQLLGIDGVAERFYDDPSVGRQTFGQLYWELKGGQVEFTRYRLASGAVSTECQDASTCTVAYKGSWTMLRIDGPVLTFLERVQEPHRTSARIVRMRRAQ